MPGLPGGDDLLRLRLRPLHGRAGAAFHRPHRAGGAVCRLRGAARLGRTQRQPPARPTWWPRPFWACWPPARFGARAGGLEIAGLSPPRRLCGPAGHLLDRPANPPGSRAHLPPPRRAGRPGRLPGSDRRAGDHRPVVGRLSRVHRRPERRPALRPRPRPHGPRRQFRPLPGHRPAGRLALAVAIRPAGSPVAAAAGADHGGRPLRQLHPQRLDRRRPGATAGAGAHAPRAVADAGRGRHDRRRAAAGRDQDGQPRQLRSRIARCLRRQERRAAGRNGLHLLEDVSRPSLVGHRLRSVLQSQAALPGRPLHQPPPRSHARPGAPQHLPQPADRKRPGGPGAHAGRSRSSGAGPRGGWPATRACPTGPEPKGR